MKKILSLGLAAVLLVGCFSGCGKTEPDSTSQAEAPDVAKSSPKDEIVEIQFFHTTWVEGMLEILDEAIAGFEKEHPNIKIVETRTS